MALIIALVIGERIVTPSAIVHLLIKIRISPPIGQTATFLKTELSEEITQKSSRLDQEKDDAFLTSKRDSEEISASTVNRAAHAPFWPSVRLRN